MKRRSMGKPLAVVVFLLITWGQAQQWEMRVCADPNNLPYSNRQMQGFENRIAMLLAKELKARLNYFWLPAHHGLARDSYSLQSGACDLFMGVYDAQEPFLTTLAYYQSSYVFAYLETSSLTIKSLDDPVLHSLRIATQTPASPPDLALGNRGLTANLRHYPTDLSESNPLEPIIAALVRREVDVAVVWGPLAGYFAKQQGIKLKLVPVTPEFEPGLFLSMAYSIAIGVRSKDDSLRNLLNLALTRRWEEIQAVLEEYGVPLLPLPKPELSGVDPCFGPCSKALPTEYGGQRMAEKPILQFAHSLRGER